MFAPHVPEPYVTTLSRRATLEWLAAISLTAALPKATWGAMSTATPSVRDSGGYGTDPDLNKPVVPWPLVMEPHQLQLIAVLADLILPASATTPAPSALGVPDFVNEWVSAPYPDQVKDRATIFEGLRWIDAESARRGQRTFLDSDERTRQGILVDIAQKAPQARFAMQSTFFQRLRFLIVSAFYTTPDGLKDIGYIGNIPLAAYPPVTDQERTILDSALSKLGLSQS
jgi:hypothetical protein